MSGDRALVARATKKLIAGHLSIPETMEAVVILREKAKMTAADIARTVNISDSYVRNMIRAYRYLVKVRQWHRFSALGWDANLTEVLDEMREKAAKATPPTTRKVKKKAS